ncbi:MAG TPA: HAD-IIA family hydrolase [Anaerolineaceae bacterium]|jgi:NagD protein
MDINLTPELVDRLTMPAKRNYLIDMDGVLISGNTLIPGADEFIQRLHDQGSKFLLLTNNSRHTPRDLAFNLQNIGLKIQTENIFTSALATARFLQSQNPHGTVYVIGESGLTSALHEIDYIITDRNPDYVVLGETFGYNFDHISRAVRLILDGARFICTNPDANGPGEGGIVPACGAMAALIEVATGVRPFFVGKPNPLMMRSALRFLGVHSEETVMIGDRMDTDMIAGVQTGLDTILVLSGVTRIEEVNRYPYVPGHIVGSVGDIYP